MGSTKAVIGLLALSTFALLPSGAWAWGGEGHRIIALIAADRLTPAARAEVSDLLGGDARGSMEEVPPGPMKSGAIVPKQLRGIT